MNTMTLKTIVAIKIFLLQFFFFQSSTAHAQLDVEYEWVAQMWGASTVQVYDIALDGDENVYAIGRFNVSSGYFDNDNLFTPTIPGPGSNNSVFIVKYDKNRVFQWVRAAGAAQYDEGYSIHVDASNNVYATGVFNGTVSFGSHTLTSKNTGSGMVKGDAFVVKLNSSGTFLWAKSFGGTGTVMYSHSITTDPSGNIYLTGYFAGGHVMNFSTSGGTRNVTGAGSGRSNAYVLKLDNNGNDLWVNTYGASSSDVMGRAVVADGSNIYVMGYFNGTVDFRSTGSYPQASSVSGSGGANHLGSYFVLRISQSLGMASAPIVISRSGASGWSYGRTLALSGGYVYVTGEQGSNAFVAKYDASTLNNQWMKTFGATARGNGIAVDGDGNVYTTGYFTGASFSPGGGGASLSKKGTRDAYLHVLDGNGDFLTAKQFGGPGAEVTGMGIKVAPSPSKAIYIGGYFGGYNKTTDFDPNAGIANVNPLSSSSDGFIVKLNPMTCTTPSAPTATNQSFCASENAIISDLAVSGETGATFTWYDASTGGTALSSGTALTNGAYYVSQTVDGCESPRTAVTVTITNPAAPTAVDQSFCDSDAPTVADLIASGETGATFTWYDASTGGTALPSGTALTNGTYYVSQTVDGCESPRTAVTVTINPGPSAPSTNATQVFCNSATVGDLIATGSDLQWYDVATGGSPLSSGTALTNGTYYVSQTVDGCESSRIPVTVEVTTDLTPSVSISGTPTSSICAGESVTFTATPTNGGSNPAYQWQVNGVEVSGETGSTFTTTDLNDGDIVTVVMTSDYPCANPTSASADTDAIVVGDDLVPSVSISGTPTSSICAGESVIFTATPTNGGSNPAYQWQINGVDVAGETGSTFTTTDLNDGDIVTVVMTSDHPCANPTSTSADTDAIVVGDDLTPSVSISGTPTSSICAGESVTFTATPTNGGSNPAYQWQVNGVEVSGETGSTFTTTDLNDGDIVTVVMTSDHPCANPTSTSADTDAIVVGDDEAPVFTDCPTDITVSSGNDCEAIVTWTSPTATDNCTTTPVITSSHNSGDIFPVGTTEVTYTAEDDAGNVTTCSFNVTVVDDEAPVFVSCVSDTAMFIEEACGVVLPDFTLAVDVADNCSSATAGTLTLTQNPAAGTSLGVGTHTVELLLEDAGGNTSTCSFEIVVSDTLAPVIEIEGLSATYCAGEEVVWTTNISDNCGVDTVTSTHDSGESFPVGTTTVTYTAVDASGNVSTYSFDVVVGALPSAADLGAADFSVCLGRDITLSIDNPEENTTYSWVFLGDEVGTGTSHTVTSSTLDDEGTYIVVSTSPEGCVFVTEVELSVNQCEIVISGGISPNGDGLNDVFEIGGIEAYPKTEVWIYNRWGAEVYHSEDYKNDWDGTSQSSLNVGGNELPEGTYYYVIRLGGYEGQLNAGETYKGYVYLKR